MSTICYHWGVWKIKQLRKKEAIHCKLFITVMIICFILTSPTATLQHFFFNSSFLVVVGIYVDVFSFLFFFCYACFFVNCYLCIFGVLFKGFERVFGISSLTWRLILSGVVCAWNKMHTCMYISYMCIFLWKLSKVAS